MANTNVRGISAPLIKCVGAYSTDNCQSFTYQEGGEYLSSSPVVSGFNVTNGGTYIFLGYVDITFELGAYPTGIALPDYSSYENLTSDKVGLNTANPNSAHILYSTNGDRLPSLTEGKVYFKKITIAYPSSYPYSLGEEVIIADNEIHLTVCTFWAGQISAENRLNIRLIPIPSIA